MSSLYRVIYDTQSAKEYYELFAGGYSNATKWEDLADDTAAYWTQSYNRRRYRNDDEQQGQPLRQQ